jgi:hypothetical protein
LENVEQITRPSGSIADRPLSHGTSTPISGEQLIAGVARFQGGSVGARHHLQDCASRDDDLLLQCDALSGELAGLAIAGCDMLEPVRLEQANAIEHQRGHRQHSQHEQSRPDAEPCMRPDGASQLLRGTTAPHAVVPPCPRCARSVLDQG